MSRIVVTPAASEPLTIEEVKRHLRVDTGSVEAAPGAPSVGLASPAQGGNVDAGAHRYRITFRTVAGETEGGVPSAAITVNDPAVNGRVELTEIPLGGSWVRSRAVYRTKANGGEYLLAGVIEDNATRTYEDNLADAQLGQGVPAQNTTDDPTFAMLIASARAGAEGILGRALITQTVELTRDRFPARHPYWLQLEPIQAVKSITYIDTDGALQTMPEANYKVDARSIPARIAPAYGLFWPSTLDVIDAVTIQYLAGFGDTGAQVPEMIRSWMLMRIGALWENRAELAVDQRTQLIEIPASFLDGLLSAYRVWTRV